MTQQIEANRGRTDEAGRVLEARLASGEINQAEYRERAAVLQASQARRRASTSRRLPLEPVLGAALLVAFLALVLGAMGGGGSMMMSGHMRDRSAGTTSPPVAGGREVTVEAGDLWFRPTGLEIQPGEPLNVTLTNTGRLFHDFVIDELDFRVAADSGAAVRGGLRLDRPGEYRYYCSVPGHAAAGMTGILEVVGVPK